MVAGKFKLWRMRIRARSEGAGRGAGVHLLHAMSLVWQDHVLTYHSNSTSPLRLLTKGDNNLADDTELYARGQSFLNRKEDVIGSVIGFIPFVGYVTILLSEYPWLKQAMLGMMGLMVVLQRE
jgi:hypothetical protein